MNLVLIPLEGVSQTLFWQYREAMPTLWALSNRSAMFRRFYSASTSALPSFCDVAHGESMELDHNAVYPSATGCLAGNAKNLFADLRGRGYEALGVQHGSACPDYVANDFWGAWPKECGAFQWHRDYVGFHAATDAFLEKMRVDGKQFILYFSDRAGLPGDVSAEKDGAVLYHERFETGFSLLDRSTSRLLDKLTALGLLAETVIVAYGPYGMDPWKHGINRGRTVALEPYADLCWTPLFIFFNGNDVGIADQLISTIDLRPTLMHMLFPQEAPEQPASPFSGVDILSFKRQTAFSQNLFALELEDAGPALGLVKSYAATDGDQRLIVSSDGRGGGGMELYYDTRDPGNTRNFLDFFRLDDAGRMTAFGRPDIIHPHFTMSFKQNLVISLVKSYNTMRELLYGFIRNKEQVALVRADAEAKVNIFPDHLFTKKRKRK